MESMSAIGVLARVQQDHREIKQMLRSVNDSVGDRRRDAFEDLVRKLAIHETLEEEIIHPMLKESDTKDVYDAILAQEGNAEDALSTFEGLDANSGEFDTRFQVLRAKVLAHAEFEETSEHPRIAQREDPDTLERLNSLFDAAEHVAPTRPHSQVPDGRGAKVALAPLLAVSDRVRDAVRNANGDS